MEEKEQEEASIVSDKIIRIFISKLSAEKGYEEIAKRFEKIVFDKKINESSIRSALFDEEVS